MSLLPFALKLLPLLQLTVTGIAPEKGGQICVAVYSSPEGFLRPEKVFRTFKKKVEKGQTSVLFELDLQAGEVALAVFQDENLDEKLSTNWLGIPSEAYGFSNGARPKFRAATWAEAKIDVPSAGRSLEIRIENW